MKNDSLKLNLAEVHNAEVGFCKEYRLTGNVEKDEEIDFASNLEVRLSVCKIDKGMMVDGNVSGKIGLICHRCGKDFDKNVDIKFDRYISEDQEDEYVLGEDLTFDFNQLIKDEIILNLPMKILCSENCKG